MATNPADIQLTDEERRRLARLADQHGITWQALVEQAVAHLEQAQTHGEPPAWAELPPDVEEDTEYVAYCMEELRELEAQFGPEALTVENARRILSKVSGSIVDVLNQDRGER